jgi:hypothetical protein
MRNSALNPFFAYKIRQNRPFRYEIALLTHYVQRGEGGEITFFAAAQANKLSFFCLNGPFLCKNRRFNGFII